MKLLDKILEELQWVLLRLLGITSKSFWTDHGRAEDPCAYSIGIVSPNVGVTRILGVTLKDTSDRSPGGMHGVSSTGTPGAISAKWSSCTRCRYSLNNS